MPDAVVILGAGSSADFGVPVLRGVFKDPHARRYLQENERLRTSLQDAFWDPRGHGLESSDESLTVEEILTVLKDWEREATVPDPDIHYRFERFRKDLYVLIQHAVFEGKSSRPGYLNPLIEFCRRNFDRTTWASFNWDCIFESSFYYSSDRPWPAGRRRNPAVEVDLTGWAYPTNSHLLLKLHGSINWWVVDGRLQYVRWGRRRGNLTDKWIEYDESDDPDDFPVILEPSFYKYEAEDEAEQFLLDQLQPQWRRLLEHIVDADHVIVIGYSLPPADSLARSTILTGFQVQQDARWLVVDPSARIRDRYRRLLGRDRVTCLDRTLAAFSQDLNAHLDNAFPDLEAEPVDT